MAANQIFIGTAGFSYKDWEGIVYPPGIKKNQHPVQFLAQYFDCCEITAKLSRSCTHAPGGALQSTSAATLNPLEEDETNAKKGLDSIAIEDKLGALLIQFPISIKNADENRKYLENLIKRFRQYPLVVEVRHATWDDPDILAQFAAQGVGFCNIDQPRLGRAVRATEHAT